MRYTEEDLAKNNDQFVFGRVAEYSKKRGYGHIYTEDRKEVFLSSYALGKLENKIAIGSVVKFKPAKVEGKICATELEIVDALPNGRLFTLPNKKSVYIRNVQKFGIVSGKRAAQEIGISDEEIAKNNININDLEYLYIVVNYEEFKFFGKNSPVKGDGQINTTKTFKDLCVKYLYLS